MGKLTIQSPDGMRTIEVHSSLTPEVVMDGAQRQMFGTDNVGFCLSCGQEADDCEPDARWYTCESCGEQHVFGAEELIAMGFGT